MEVISLGETLLDLETILEYLDSLKEIYAAESYDLFAHNCNNFTNDFSQFLVGRGIPDHITSLPRRVLETSFGQMLRPQLDQAMGATTQAPVPPASERATNGITGQTSTLGLHGHDRSPARNDMGLSVSSQPGAAGSVYNVTTIERLDQLLDEAKSSCAILFLTSATCGPCRVLYPTYEGLAEEAKGKCFLIKVDVGQAQAVGRKYDVRGTPTFVTYLKGRRESTWTGANPSQLRESVQMLIQSAFPAHPHERLSIPTFRRQPMKPMLNTKLSPLDKVRAKMGDAAQDPGMQASLNFIARREEQKHIQEAVLPDMTAVTASIQRQASLLPPESRFIAFDILRLLLLDPRVSGYYLASTDHLKPLQEMLSLENPELAPYNLRLTMLHASTNIFRSPGLVLSSTLLSNEAFISSLIGQISTAMKDTAHAALRLAAAMLAFNIATFAMQSRTSTNGPISNATFVSESSQLELAAALLQALDDEPDSADTLKLLSIALGRLVYLQPADSELIELALAMEAFKTVSSKSSLVKKEDKVLMHEIGVELLDKGLKR